MCLCGGLAEDNARFILLAVVLAAYMLAGAVLFQRLESDLEIRQVQMCLRMYRKENRKLDIPICSLQLLKKTIGNSKKEITTSLRNIMVNFVRSTSKLNIEHFLK